jgi:hypothetical protein
MTKTLTNRDEKHKTILLPDRVGNNVFDSSPSKRMNVEKTEMIFTQYGNIICAGFVLIVILLLLLSGCTPLT